MHLSLQAEIAALCARHRQHLAIDLRLRPDDARPRVEVGDPVHDAENRLAIVSHQLEVVIRYRDPIRPHSFARQRGGVQAMQEAISKTAGMQPHVSGEVSGIGLQILREVVSRLGLPVDRHGRYAERCAVGWARLFGRHQHTCSVLTHQLVGLVVLGQAELDRYRHR